MSIFVFGSNEAGRHGKGAALFAIKNHGAKYGTPYGLQGNAFAIPTKDKKLNSLPLHAIKIYVDKFIKFAKNTPDKKYEVTKIGCGLAGYKESDIAPMFSDAPENCILPDGWRMHRLINPVPNPRYDDVYHDGVKWLDSLS